MEPLKNFFRNLQEKIRVFLSEIEKLDRKVKWRFAILAVTACLGIFTGFFLNIEFNLPDVRALKNYNPSETSKIYDIDGKVIANIHGEENRVVIPFSEVPVEARQALIAAEDNYFYQHHGLDFRGIFRALAVNVKSGGFRQGGSTLSQQLVKNLFLSHRKSIFRKLVEAQLALKLEKNFSKDEIMEMYFNQVYWGHNAYGIEAAAQNYFGKHAKELNLAETTLLIGLLQAPEAYSPYHNEKFARFRQKVVLDQMKELGYISDKQVKEALATPLTFPGPSSYAYNAPYFVDYVKQLLSEKFDDKVLSQAGLKIYTTLDLEATKYAQKSLSDALKDPLYKDTYKATQGAMLAIDPRTGYIKVMVGGGNYAETKFNRTVQARRQPGSAFKPFVYYAAFESGKYTPASVVDDSRIEYQTPQGKWVPQNYDKIYRGPVTVRTAVEQSINVVAVKVLDDVGIGRTINVARKMGIESPLQTNLALTLGVSEVTPLELASAYGVLANEGVKVEPVAILKVEDKDGRVLYQYQPKDPQLVLDPSIVDVLNNVLTGVIQRGTGMRAAAVGRPAAGKTGTTSDDRDAWFVGYTPNMVGLVWIGNDDNTPMVQAFGGNACAPLWADFMRKALEKEPVMSFVPPSSKFQEEQTVEVTVCSFTGKIATEECPNPVVKKFVPGQEPKEFCPLTRAQHP